MAAVVVVVQALAGQVAPLLCSQRCQLLPPAPGPAAAVMAGQAAWAGQAPPALAAPPGALAQPRHVGCQQWRQQLRAGCQRVQSQEMLLVMAAATVVVMLLLVSLQGKQLRAPVLMLWEAAAVTVVVAVALVAALLAPGETLAQLLQLLALHMSQQRPLLGRERGGAGGALPVALAQQRQSLRVLLRWALVVLQLVQLMLGLPVAQAVAVVGGGPMLLLGVRQALVAPALQLLLVVLGPWELAVGLWRWVLWCAEGLMGAVRARCGALGCWVG